MSANLPSDFFIFTSIRFEPNLTEDDVNLPYYLLPFHLLRLRDAAAEFQLVHVQQLLQDDEAGIQLLKTAVDDAVTDRTQSWRVNVKIHPDCKISTMTTQLKPLSHEIVKLPSGRTADDLVQFLQGEREARNLPIWDVLVDTVATPRSRFTGHKTSVRGMYNEARDRAGLVSYEEPRETLLWNEEGQVTEGSITTVYVWRGRNGTENGYLATPPLSTGCNASSTRRYALSKGLCVEEAVDVSELAEGEEVWLSHASDGFFPGKIRRSRVSKE
ncbi:aminotransferase class IV domain-containing protein [Pochonia chlamydosporia 170]|uniref:Aminotransferase class IV domain-containing protein n=1 Tax=Pochonia chlamydosporia 170 TaxID=1380566 RepID=A0A179FRM1_METCM|nr:aminotransferase class IV domain-containing protein [Pochonia chlamydosporia 170]OAQ67669.1 aminotransferase class IV domain-containing protein [Pochonia chlamydosporia 170]